jgi:chloramphenicol O-acetyltransferase
MKLIEVDSKATLEDFLTSKKKTVESQKAHLIIEKDDYKYNQIFKCSLIILFMTCIVLK